MSPPVGSRGRSPDSRLRVTRVHRAQSIGPKGAWTQRERKGAAHGDRYRVLPHRKPPQGTPACKREGHAEHCPATMNTVPFLASALGKVVYLSQVGRPGAAALPGRPVLTGRTLTAGYVQVGSAADCSRRVKRIERPRAGALVFLRGTAARMGPSVRNRGNGLGGPRSLRIYPGESSRSYPTPSGR